MTFSDWAKQFDRKPAWYVRFKIWKWKPGQGPIDRLIRFYRYKIKGEKG